MTAYYTSGAGKIGKVQSVTDAASNTTTFDYDSSTGRRTKVTDALSKDTLYTYNSRGQVLTVRGDASYPLDYSYDNNGWMTQLKTYRDDTLTTPDVTTWAYQNSTGLLTSKTYADDKAVSYEYDSANRLSERTWARVTQAFQPVVSSYSYNLAGDLTGIDYSDTTPDIAFTYNRLGQQKTVNDVVGTRTFAYNSALQLSSETIDGSSGGLYSKTINRSYETSGVTGRYTGVNIGTEYDVDYGYDTYGRLSSVVCPLSSETFTYSYLANSNLVSGITYPNNISVTKSYEPNRDLVTLVANKYSTTTLSQYGYTYDDLGRREDMAKSGTAFSASDTINYGYNDRSEVTSAEAANDTTYNYGFAFDPIGNRLSDLSYETGAPVSTSYTTNSLNQYSLINDGAPKTPVYDDDGNMTQCSLGVPPEIWTFTWNGENRKIAAEKSDQRLEFSYDYMGRRVSKKVYSGNPGSWTLDKHLYFVYDGYDQVEELDALDSNAIEKKYVLAMGQRLSITDSNLSATYYYFADANKNIGQLIDSTGTVVAKYEYSPFGKITVKSGSYADENPYRFSSEFYDSETGLVYYNYRYYSPELGRWMNRDKIGERGGINLLAFVQNDPVGRWDQRGQVESKTSSSGDRYRHYDWPYGTIPDPLLPIEPQDPWPPEFLIPETVPIFLVPSVFVPDPLDGKPCCEDEAKVVTFTVKVKKHFPKFYTAFFTAKRSMTLNIQIDDARAIKAVFWRCHARGAGGNWGAISESILVAPNILNTIVRTFSGGASGTYITGVKISYYSCVGGNKTAKKEGVWQRILIEKGGIGGT